MKNGIGLKKLLSWDLKELIFEKTPPQLKIQLAVLDLTPSRAERPCREILTD